MDTRPLFPPPTWPGYKATNMVVCCSEIHLFHVAACGSQLFPTLDIHLAQSRAAEDLPSVVLS